MDSHSVNWARGMDVPQLADMALRADDFIVEHGEERDTFHQQRLEFARNTRRQALDELRRRGELTSYYLV